MKTFSILLVLALIGMGALPAQAGDFQWLRTAGGSGVVQAVKKFV